MAEKSCVTYVSRKISRIRWRVSAQKSLQQADTFVAGSWDDKKNTVSLWCLKNDQQNDGIPNRVQKLCEVLHAGDVTDILFANTTHVVVSSSFGHVTVYRFHENLQTLSKSQQWAQLHHHVNRQNCSCTSLSQQNDDIVTVGEDGKINLLNLEHKTPTRTIEKADSCTLNAVHHISQAEIATVNSSGQLKVWDLRRQSNIPSQTYLMHGPSSSLHCVDSHPSQSHVVATGGRDGMLYVWDMRQEKFPVSLLEGHSSDMWELKFHPSHPDHLFTCSEDGQVWHWDSSGANNAIGIGYTKGVVSSASGFALQSNVSSTSVWLTTDTSANKLKITSLLPEHHCQPVNCLDIESSTVLCGTDSEAIYTVPIVGIS